MADPAFGLISYDFEEFLKYWAGDHEEEGYALLLEPTPEFFREEGNERPTRGFKILFSYLTGHRSLLFQVLTGLLTGSILALVAPFLTQTLVDFGVNNRDIGFVYTILLAQLMLFLGANAIEFIRGWVLIHLGIRINLSILSDFLIKLMKLRLSFFEGQLLGDLIQRINDHNRVEQFLTTHSLNTLFSLFNLAVFSLVLGFYNLQILLVFLVGSAISVIWMLAYLRRRRELDYRRFNQMAEHQTNLVEMITSMPEIKLTQCQQKKRWDWEHIQAKLFKLSLKGLALGQQQQAGARFFNELKNIAILFLAASHVINGTMTLGMMLAVTYIIGQLSGPIDQLINFTQTAQDAKLSFDRIGEIHEMSEEEEKGMVGTADSLPTKADLRGVNLSFHYGAPGSPRVLKDLNFAAEYQKTTAIVGASGSGKTTLLKLMLKFYQPSSGQLTLGSMNLTNVSSEAWRRRCGVVMQDGFIFNDTVARNIAPGDDIIDRHRLMESARVANIGEFVESLPHAYNARIGQGGHGLSQGQKQRILIARAVYRNPDYLLFDEATSALDAENERVIMDRLERFCQNRTVIVVAHRLSTVKNADQIICLHNGTIVETGSHYSLSKAKGYYYNLVKNQLELGV